MKKNISILLGVCILFVSCQLEKLDTQENTVFESSNVSSNKKGTDKVKVVKECNVVDLDRCDLEGYTSNFWWPESPTNFTQGLFGSDENNSLKLVEYNNGTANITGSTVLGDCTVHVDVWLHNKLNWEDFQASGGSFKDEPNDCTNVDPALLHYYVIDSSKSSITAEGDCYQTGTFGVEQRPDPNDDSTPHFGVIVGPGAGLFDDSDINAYGLSTWGWITDLETGERLWVLDFNFNLECDDCETAFAIGNTPEGEGDDSTCFLEDGFSRWGWTIGPLSTGEYTYDVYAGAGQCDTDKGTLVGTATVTYSESGDVSVSYDISEGYTMTEEHTYAGTAKYPTNNGADTVAPGQYTITPGLSGDIYVILHSVICEDE